MIAAGLAVGALAVAPPAFAENTPPAQAGSDWLSSELTDGLIVGGYLDDFSDPATPVWVESNDYGLSIDSGIALADVDEANPAVADVSDAIAADLEDYITGEAFGDTGSTYAGATAKAAAFALIAGDDPTSYGGVNLKARLEGVTGGSAPIAGRIEDVTTFGTDYANTIGQGFAVEALSRTGSTEAAAATDFLLKQQCEEGFFRLNFTANKAAADQTCDGGDANASAPDTDTTALVLLNLQRANSTHAGVPQAIADANAWLLSTQKADGSWGGGPSTEASNTNSTGLAGWALGAGNEVDAATDAAAYVRSFQVFAPDQCESGLTGEDGAIAYDQAGYSAGLSDGITLAAADQWRRATAQALPLLESAPLVVATPAIRGPEGYVSSKDDVTLKVSGLERGERFCISGGSVALVRAAKAGTEVGKVNAPNKTGTVRYTLTSPEGTDTVDVSVLGKTELKVNAKKETVRKGQTQKVVVKGLAAGEKVKIKVDGKVVAKGKANSAGKFKKKFKVTARRGPAKVKARGEFANRNGTDRFVVR